MAALPRELRQALGAALRSLKSDAIAVAIHRVGEHDGELEEALHRLAAQFDYQTILDALPPD